MLDTLETRKDLRVGDVLLRLFPLADEEIVRSLRDRRDTLMRYLAQTHELSLLEVCEVLDVFAPMKSRA